MIVCLVNRHDCQWQLKQRSNNEDVDTYNAKDQDLSRSIMTTVKKSLAISIFEKYSITLIQLISSMIIARLLTPTEIGVFSVGVLIIGFAHMLRDFGISNYIIQEKNLTKDKIKSANLLTTLLAWSCALVLYSIATPLAKFYNEPGVQSVINVVIISFIAIPFSSVIFSLLRREMKFKVLFWINILSTLANSVTGVVLAYLGYGYMSLAWAVVAGTATTLILALILRPKNAYLLPSTKEFRAVFSYGTKSSIASIAIELGQNSPELIIGRTMNFESVGIFSRAMGLASLFNKLIMSGVQSVALPFFAKANREATGIEEPSSRSITYLLSLAWPFYAFMAIYAEELITILYGNQWLASVDIAKLLCLVFSIRIVPSIISWIMISTGQVHENMVGRLIWELSALAFVIPASFYGLEAVGIALVCSNLIGYIIFLRHAIKNKILSHKKHFYIIKSNILLTIPLFIIALLIRSIFIKLQINIFTNFIFGSLLYLFVWISLIFIMKHPFHVEIKQQLNSLTTGWRREKNV
ncbi:MAG: O-antigen/teichoic acid export membrane protein [Motiliproteus sp.]